MNRPISIVIIVAPPQSDAGTVVVQICLGMNCLVCVICYITLV